MIIIMWMILVVENRARMETHPPRQSLIGDGDDIMSWHIYIILLIIIGEISSAVSLSKGFYKYQFEQLGC